MQITAAFRSTAVAIAFFVSATAFAHELNFFASVENGVIHGRAYYGESGPAVDIPVQVLGPQNQTFATLETDAEGRVRYVPDQRVRHTLIAETPDGHRAQATIQSDDLPDLSTTASTAESVTHLDERIAQAVAREVRPLREQLDRYEHATRLRDILGGIGYIVGAAGALALLKARGKTGK